MIKTRLDGVYYRLIHILTYMM